MARGRGPRLPAAVELSRGRRRGGGRRGASPRWRRRGVHPPGHLQRLGRPLDDPRRGGAPHGQVRHRRRARHPWLRLPPHPRRRLLPARRALPPRPTLPGRGRLLLRAHPRRPRLPHRHPPGPPSPPVLRLRRRTRSHRAPLTLAHHRLAQARFLLRYASKWS